MPPDTLTDFTNLSEESAQELRKAIDTPAEQPKPAETLDAETKKEETVDNKTETKKEGEQKKEEKTTDEKSNVLDVEDPEGEKKEEGEGEKKEGAEENKNNTLDLIDYNGALKAAGFDVETPITNQSEYEQALKKGFDSVKEKAKAELLIEVTEMAGYDPMAQFHLKMIKAGVPVEELATPGKGFDEVIALSNEELMLRELLAGIDNPTDQDKADAQLRVDTLKEDGLLEKKAEDLRNILKKDKAAFVDNFHSKRKAFVEARLKALDDKSVAFDNAVVDAIKKTEKFLDFDLTDRLKDQIVKKFQSQDQYRTRLTSDAKFLAEMILKNELLERALNQLRKTSTETAKAEVKIEKHKENYNVNDISKQEKSSESSREGVDGFEAWGAVRTQKVRAS